MRINQYLANATSLSRRSADQAVAEGRVAVNGQPAMIGQLVGVGDTVALDGQAVLPEEFRTIIFNKPAGVVCSRRRQGNSPTIYDVLPPEFQSLNPVGRLDKDTSGLLILTNNGQLHHKLSHPSQGKSKVYEVTLDRRIQSPDLDRLKEGVALEDGPSRPKIIAATGRQLQISLEEGRNRQVRRTFAALGYKVTGLHRREMGSFSLGGLETGQWREIRQEELK